MKILFAIKKFGGIAGGAEKVLSIVSSKLAKRGHEVIILTFDEKNKKPFYYLDETVQLINIDICNKFLSNKYLQFFRRTLALRKKILEVKPDVVVGFMHSIYILLSLSLIGLKINLIASEHIVPQYYKNRKFEYLLINISTFFIKKFTVLSDDIKKNFSFLIRRKMIVLNNPIESKFFLKSPKLKSKYTILSVGRLTEKKDHQTLIKAFSTLIDKYKNWNLLIVGEGHLRPYLENLIKDLNIGKNVFLPGVSSNIYKYYESADIFVIPSRFESFGLVVGEAMSSSLPIIGFKDCPGITKLIINNRTGFLVECRDNRVIPLAQAIKKLMDDEKMRFKFGKLGYERIKTYSSTDNIIVAWENLLFENIN